MTGDPNRIIQEGGGCASSLPMDIPVYPEGNQQSVAEYRLRR